MAFDKMIVKKLLKKFDDVPFVVKFPDGEEFKVGEGEPQAIIRANGGIDMGAVMKSPSLALGEAYMDKTLELEKGDLFEILNMVLAKLEDFASDFSGLTKIMKTSTSKKNQKQEIATHYDIGNEFFELWLDETMSYSCGYFKHETDTLYDAQVHKVEHILKKLNLKEGQTLLDIGCGWGYLLIAAAKKYHVEGVGITLSEEQYKKGQERIKEEGLEGQVEIRLMDYRDLEKSGMTFDRIVSVGMLEHVSRDNYPLFFKNIDKVLNKKGIVLLHYISGRQEHDGDPWIKKYIFPGGIIPSLREIIYLIGEYNYYTLDVESLRRHYEKTLLEWSKNYAAKRDVIDTMFEERFVRMWELYLVSCASVFHNGICDIHQILFTKGVDNDLPMTRNYLYED